MRPEDRIRCLHIIDEAIEACKYVEGILFDEFVQDGKTIRAVIRSLEVVGEAASKLSMDFRNQHPDIPWQKIIGMRNRLIHVYFVIDSAVIWDTVKKKRPAFINQLESILEQDGFRC